MSQHQSSCGRTAGRALSLRPFGMTLGLILYLLIPGKAVADDHWPGFRGKNGLGIGSGSPPTTWDLEAGTNIAWQRPIPGLGHSSPVVWGHQVFVTTAVPISEKRPELKVGWLGGTGSSADDESVWTWRIICYDARTGKRLWSKDAHRGEPVIARHLKASHANSTPATNGKHVVAFFGSEGLYCYTMNGQLVWKKDFGRLHSGPYDAKELEWGFASSPVIHDGKVIVQCDCLNEAFVAVLNIATGEEILRIDRENEVATWSTPAIAAADDRTQIVCNGFHQMAGYDLNTGRKLWHLSGGGDVPVPTPLIQDGLIFLTNAHGGSHTFAIRSDATGDLTPHDGEQPPGLAWWQDRDGSYMPTPLVLGGRLYLCNDNGRLSVRHALSGDLIYRRRVGTGTRTFSASAVAAGGHLYFCSERGEVSVVKEGNEFELVATNDMNDIVMATPAIAGDSLLIRTAQRLVCIRADRDD